MATNTPNLNLLKKDPVEDGADTFNIELMLNENWDKVDAALPGAAVKEKPEAGDAVLLYDSADSGKPKRGMLSAIAALLSASESLKEVFASKSHKHLKSEISDFPITMPPAEHEHGAGDITSGELALARGGTGAGTAADARQNLGAACTPAGVLVTFPVAGWTALEGGGYTQTVTAAGLLSTDDKRTATVCSVGSTDKEAQALTDAAYNLVDRWSCDTDGQLTARCPEGAPEVEFQAYVVIVR